MDNRAKAECQSREEWGRPGPNRRAKRISSEDRAKTSHLAGRYQASVEQVSEVGDCHRRVGLRVDKKGKNAQCVRLSNTIVAFLHGR